MSNVFYLSLHRGRIGNTDFSQQFPVCATEALLTERRKGLYVLDKEHGDEGAVLSALRGNTDHDTSQIRYLLMERQGIR